MRTQLAYQSQIYIIKKQDSGFIAMQLCLHLFLCVKVRLQLVDYVYVLPLKLASTECVCVCNCRHICLPNFDCLISKRLNIVIECD